MRRLLLLSALSLAFATACGDDSRPDNVDPDTGGKGGRTSRGGATNGGDGGVAGEAGTGGTTAGGTNSGGQGGSTSSSISTSPGAPVVTFLSPPSVLDPNAAGVITSNEVTVTCKATASAEAGATVNEASALIVLSQDGLPVSGGQLGSAMVNGARETRFTLETLHSGKIAFDCSAEDYSNPKKTGSAPALELLYDAGPTINISQPSADQNLSLTAGVDVAFSISGKPIADGDSQFAVATLDVLINGKSVTIPESTTTPGSFSGHVALNDPLLFPPADRPSGPTTLQVIAKNARGTVSELVRNFSVDSTPPVITYVNPSKPTVVGGNTKFEFTVVDKGAGVDESTVGIRINSGTTYYYRETDAARWTHAKASDSYTFMTTDADFTGSIAQATINVSASDKVKNASTADQALVVFLDQQPPIVSLDPPTVRERYFDTDVNAHVCSVAFDPLGEAVNDLTIDNGAALFRALVWDATNAPLDASAISYYAGTDPSNVSLFFQDKLDVPLLVDTDKDGFCDDIARGTDGERKPVATLTSIEPTGTAPFAGELNTNEQAVTIDTAKADDTRFGAAPPMGNWCAWKDHWKAWDRDDETFRCTLTSDMVRVIKHSLQSTPAERVIYGIGVESGSLLGCTGTYWEYTSFIKRTPRDGWVCFAAMAVDKVGNRGVSNPMRLCYDDPATPVHPTCATTFKAPNVSTYQTGWVSFIRNEAQWDPYPTRSEEAPPLCTDGCKLRERGYPSIITNQ
jgi:hypothetical protein